MKTSTRILYRLLLLTTGLSSCTVDVSEYSSEPGLPVNITIQTGSRADNDPQQSGIHYGDSIDSRIDNIRVLGYNSATGRLAFNRTISFSGSSDPANGEVGGTIEVITGTYDFVFIANENSDPALSTRLTNGIATITRLRELSVAEEAFAGDLSIPMVRKIDGVEVVSDNHIVKDGTHITGTWAVPLERLAVRVELTLNMPDAFATGEVLSFENVPDRVYLIRKNQAANSVTSRLMGAAAESVSAEGVTTKTWKRIILPENWFSPVNNENRAVEIRLTHGNNTKSARLGVDPDGSQSGDYTMPRNSFFDLRGNVQGEGNIELSAQVMDWQEALDLGLAIGNPMYYLELVHVDMEIDNIHGYTVVLGVRTNYSGNWTAVASDSGTETQTPPQAGWWDEDEWMNWPETSNGGLKWPFTAKGNKDIRIRYNQTTLDASKPVFIHITAGRLTVVARITPVSLSH